MLANSTLSLGWTSGAKVSLVGLLIAVAISVEAADRVLLAGLCTPLRWRLHQPGQEGEADREGEHVEDRGASQVDNIRWLFLLCVVAFLLKAVSVHVCNLACFCAALLCVFYLMKLRWLKLFPLGGLCTRPLCGAMNELARFGGTNKSRNHKPLLDKNPYFKVRHASHASDPGWVK